MITHRIEPWKWNYYDCCLGDVLEGHLLNSIQNNSCSTLNHCQIDDWPWRHSADGRALQTSLTLSFLLLSPPSNKWNRWPPSFLSFCNSSVRPRSSFLSEGFICSFLPTVQLNSCVYVQSSAHGRSLGHITMSLTSQPVPFRRHCECD